jgi:hypothetical protein
LIVVNIYDPYFLKGLLQYLVALYLSLDIEQLSSIESKDGNLLRLVRILQEENGEAYDHICLVLVQLRHHQFISVLFVRVIVEKEVRREASNGGM